MNGTVLLINRDCNVFNLQTHDLNSSELVIDSKEAIKMDQIWKSFIKSPELEIVLKTFKHSFTMFYNEQKCIFLFGENSGLMFNIDSLKTTELGSTIFNDSLVTISHWQKQTFAIFYKQKLIVHQVSKQSPLTIESTTERLLCLNENQQIFTVKENECLNFTFTPVIKRGFIAQHNVYLIGYYDEPVAYMVFIFDSKFLDHLDYNPVPLTVRPLSEFFIQQNNSTVKKGNELTGYYLLFCFSNNFNIIFLQ